MPGQPIRLLGGEVLALGAADLVATVLLQHTCLRHTEEGYLREKMRMVWTNRVAVGTVALAEVQLLPRGETADPNVWGANRGICAV
jgi:hypothetical protein